MWVCTLQQVDSKGEVNQFLPKHSQTMLEKLNQQRLSNQFCDITLLIEGEEYRAHKAVLAACSEYFNELFFEKGAVSTHEAVVDLSGKLLLLRVSLHTVVSHWLSLNPHSFLSRFHQGQLLTAAGLCVHIHAYL